MRLMALNRTKLSAAESLPQAINPLAAGIHDSNALGLLKGQTFSRAKNGPEDEGSALSSSL